MTAMTAAVADDVRATATGDPPHEPWDNPEPLTLELATASVHRLADRRSYRSGMHDFAVLALICAAQLVWLASLGYGLYRIT